MSVIEPGWVDFDRRHILPTLMTLVAVVVDAGAVQAAIVVGLVLRPGLYWLIGWVNTPTGRRVPK